MRISDWSSDVCSSDLFESHGGRLLFRWAYRCQHRRARQTKCFPACVRKNNLIGCPLHCEPEAIVKPRHLAPLNALRTFEAAARCRGFQAAAAQLFVTPAAVCHQVKLLEAYLGVELFPRCPRPVGLPPEGKVLAPSLNEHL